jgi:hypothetical protein
MYGEVPPEGVADTLTPVPTVPVAGTVGVTVNASGLIITLAAAVLVCGVGVAESVPVTLMLTVPFTL